MPLFLFLILLLALPWLFFSLFAQLSAASFSALGLSPAQSFWLFAGSLAGSVVNLPVWRQTVESPWPPAGLRSLFFYYPPEVREQVVYVNVGGALIPGLFALGLLGTRAPLLPALVDAAVVTLVAERIARPRAGVGIVLPPFIPPLVAVGVALLLVRGADVSPVAYVGGVLGTLVGADLLHLRDVVRGEALALSIGGAGVFDGIFLVGMVAALLGALAQG
ncbi:MAG: DUF1614 domain-containing protein [Firmicutes bacterium]|nr:DUF1614 domain-containing protein [Bacillota bacterium]